MRNLSLACCVDELRPCHGSQWQCAVKVQGVRISRFIAMNMLLCIQIELLCIPHGTIVQLD